MSMMHHDSSPELRTVASKLNDVLGIGNAALRTRKVVIQICDTIARRGARLSAAAVVGILKKQGRDAATTEKQRTVVAMDGGLYEHYNKFREHLESAITEMLGEAVASTVIVTHANDGSGIGAALLAASHSRYLELQES